jgi:type IX secretion system PorP/SprF family membrane protein
MKKAVFSFIFLIGGLEVLQAQDPMFSQFYSAPLYLNPALAGAETNMVIGVNYRTQWNSLQSPYQTGQVSLTHPLIVNGVNRKHIGGLGVSVFNEVAGQYNNFKTFGIVAGGAYNLPFDKWDNTFISIGLQGGIIQKKIDNGDLTWGSQYDPYFGFNQSIQPSVNNINQVVSYPVINAGLTFNHNSQKLNGDLSEFVGVAISNLNKPNESMIIGSQNQLPLLLKVHGGFDYTLNDRVGIAPQILWMRQNNIDQINVGTYLSYSVSVEEQPFIATLGTWYRVGDSFIMMVGFSKNKFSFGFSYDLTTSTLRYATRGQGAYEVSLQYRIPKLKGLRRFSTPLI